MTQATFKQTYFLHQRKNVGEGRIWIVEPTSMEERSDAPPQRQCGGVITRVSGASSEEGHDLRLCADKAVAS